MKLYFEKKNQQNLLNDIWFIYEKKKEWTVKERTSMSKGIPYATTSTVFVCSSFHLFIITTRTTLDYRIVVTVIWKNDGRKWCTRWIN